MSTGVKATVCNGPSKLRMKSAFATVYPSRASCRVVRVLRALDEADEGLCIALAPLERLLAGFQGDAGIGAEGKHAFIKLVVLVVARVVALRRPNACGSARTRCRRCTCRTVSRVPVIPWLTARCTVGIGEVVAGGTRVEPEILRLGLEVTAELVRLFRELGRLEAIFFVGGCCSAGRKQAAHAATRIPQPAPRQRGHLRSSSTRGR